MAWRGPILPLWMTGSPGAPIVSEGLWGRTLTSLAKQGAVSILRMPHLGTMVKGAQNMTMGAQLLSLQEGERKAVSIAPLLMGLPPGWDLDTPPRTLPQNLPEHRLPWKRRTSQAAHL